MALVPSTVHAVMNSRTCIAIICLLTSSFSLCSSEELFPSLVIDLSVLVYQIERCLIRN
jgi:hypothetical protein